MNLFQTVFTDFNPSKFVVYTSLFFFVVLFALRQDNFVSFSYWLVFLPLWLWKGIVVVGGVVGILVWLLNRHDGLSNASSVTAGLDNSLAGDRTDGGHSTAYTATTRHFKAMLMAFSTQMLLLIFEVLVCEKLESQGPSLKWIVVFSPLIFISILSVFICIWSIKNDRSLESGGQRMAIPGSQPMPSFSIQMELICSVNILQFIFVALRLDGVIIWRWSVVFIPLWIVMFLALIVVVYSMILACLILRNPEMFAHTRRGNINTALSHFFFIVPLLIFEAMLTKKLDYISFGFTAYEGGTVAPNPNFPYLYTTVAFPLLVSILTLLFTSVGRRGGNPWWCGIRKDFCSFLVLNLCPLLQEYGNISYEVQFDDETADDVDSISTVEGTLSNSSSYESGRPHFPSQPPTSNHPYYPQTLNQSNHLNSPPLSESLHSGLSQSFSKRLFKFKKKNLSPTTVKSPPMVPVLFIDMPD